MPNVIHGKVTGAGGQAIAQARIYIKHSPVPAPDIAMLTDQQGAFILSVPSSGNYTIGCQADELGSGEATITVNEGQDNLLTIELGK